MEENAGEVELIQTRLTCETGFEKTLISQNGTIFLDALASLESVMSLTDL